jgi:hypothetical protein
MPLSSQTVVVRPKLKISESEFFEHMRAPKSTLTHSLPTTEHDFYIAVTIDEGGRVISVAPDYPCSKDHGCAEMCDTLRKQTFRRFEIDGRPTQAIATLHFSSEHKN